MKGPVRAAGLLLILVLGSLSAVAFAQDPRAIIVDQTGLPLPGVSVQLLDGERVVTTVATDPEGTFGFSASLPGDTITASLDGFETASVPRLARRIILLLARTAETTTVVGSVLEPTSPTTALLGGTLAASTVARLPSSHMKARESLPLLPSVVRGPDGLMQLGGARAHETPLFLDGFNITDPATGISSINLPFEAVQGVDVLHDPMAITYGGLLAGMVKMESRPGGDRFKLGVQGVVPRPRFTNPGLGRIEGIFPRVFASGAAASGRVRYVAAAEYDYERIAVPGVTQDGGPDVVEKSTTMFTRVDAQLNARHQLTVEGLAFPSRTGSHGLSPRREDLATADFSAQDLFAGVTHRYIASPSSAFTMRLGVLAHDATLAPRGSGASLLSPSGWRGNWFAAAGRTAIRYSAVATWEGVKTVRGRTHDLTLGGEIAVRRLRGHVANQSILVDNHDGRTVRSVDFEPRQSVGAHDRPVGLALRDVWQATGRLQVDSGVRVDHSRYGGGTPSGRAGVRYNLDSGGLTVLKAGYGSFVGNLPLAVPSFGDYPTRVDRLYDPGSGELINEKTLRPQIGPLRFPRALAATVGVERQLRPGLDAQLSVTDRQSSRLATLHVPTESGALSLSSGGSARYRDVQLSARQTWDHDQQLFVSYVRSSARGELNDFATLFQALDAPLLQPGGMSRLASDARNRVLAWGTFNLPARVVVSPVTEWRSGFPYSRLDTHYLYAGSPNAAAFPHFIATDLVVYKTVTVRRRSADIGFQVFNATNHWNPRDVCAVVGTPATGQFTNSVGPILRGYMLVKW